MNPQRLDDEHVLQSDGSLTLDDVEVYKRYDCAKYDRCLGVAARAGWRQLTCRSCTAYVPLPDDHHARRLFTRAGATLLRADTLAPERTEARPAIARRIHPDTLRLGPVARLFSGRVREVIDDGGGDDR